MTTITATRDLYAEAELRLGRELSHGERNIDIEKLDRDLAKGKQDLYEAIDKEKRRAITAYFRYRKAVKLNITPAMKRVILSLYEKGQDHARRELRDLRALQQEFAYKRKPPTKAMGTLDQHLGRLRGKVETKATAAAAEVDIGTSAYLTMLREVSRMPGALDVASRLVTVSMYDGMGEVFEGANDVHTWIYSAVMDNKTCSVCGHYDGREFGSWEEIGLVLPGGGPNPQCYGHERCRCRAVPGQIVQRQESSPPPAEIRFVGDWSVNPAARDEVAGVVGELTARYDTALKKVVVREAEEFGQLAGKSKDTIYVSPRFLDDMFMAQHAQEWRGLVVGTGRSDIITHEFGHILDGRLLETNPQAYEDLWAYVHEPIALPGGKLIPRWSHNLEAASAYGSESRYEFIAEGFSDWVKNGENAKESSQFIGKLFDDMLARVV